MKKPSELALQTVARAWCQPTTSHKQMDVELATAFAEILDEIWLQPWLGNATTGQLLDEIRARVDCSYKTTGETIPAPECAKQALNDNVEL